MCGRYTLNFTMEKLLEVFDLENILHGFKPCFNVYPGMNVPVIVYENDNKALDSYRWGLIPVWSKEANTGYRMINARQESVAEKPAFKKPFFEKRCLIPASGFFEWKKSGKSKAPYYIHLGDREIFAFAGIAAEWKSQQGEIIKSCSIVTTEADGKIKELHDRMPIILGKSLENEWANGRSKDKEALFRVLSESKEQMVKSEIIAHKVSDYVNSPKNESHKCIEMID